MDTCETNGRARPLEYAQGYHKGGLSPFPIRGDGSKAPVVPWARFQNERANLTELPKWWLDDNVGIAIACGAASGNLEVIDVDDADTFDTYREILDAVAPGLIDKLTTIRTPRPGFHLAYRCETIEGNQKLAMAPDLGSNSAKPRVLIETRGRGGYILVPGSPGCCHPTGRIYEHVGGPPLARVPTITTEERTTLLDVARSLDTWTQQHTEPETETTTRNSDGLSPGDDYNQRATWQEILEPGGWVSVSTSGDLTHWRRPGKSIGTSATTGCTSKAGNDLLCVFSTNAPPFPGPSDGKTCSTHSRFSTFAILNHDGDFSAAARDLARQGYGDKLKRMEDLRPEEYRDELSAKGHLTSLPQITPYQRFPVECLPQAVANFVRAAASAIGCDPSFVALPLLCCLARAIGNARVIRLKRTWSEPAVIWAAIIGKSGTHKTPSLQAAMTFLQQRQQEVIACHADELISFEREQALYDRALQEWKKAKNNTDPPPWKPDVPVCTRYISTDITIEALVERLAEQFDGLLIPRDELAGWLNGIAEYKGGKGSDLGHWLAAWSAAPITVDRKTSTKKMLHVPRAAVSIVGGIQPGVLQHSIGREHLQDGLCARLLMAMPEPRPVVWTDDVIDEATEAAMGQVFNRLYDLEPAADADGNAEPYPLLLTPEAKRVWVEYFNRHRAELVELDDDLAAAWSKLEAYTARFALIFQLSAGAAGETDGEAIDQTAIESAITLSDWFGNEAKRVYGLFVESDDDRKTRELIDLIRRKGGRVTARELARSSRRYRGPGEAEATLNDLAKADYGAWTTIATGERGRPSREFVLGSQNAGASDTNS